MRPSIHQLLNITQKMPDDKDAVAKRAGMWLQDGLVHVIFCEYQTNRPAEAKVDVSKLNPS